MYILELCLLIVFINQVEVYLITKQRTENWKGERRKGNKRKINTRKEEINQGKKEEKEKRKR